MTNNTPFSSDPNPDLTRTIRSVIMNEAKYAGVERRAKSGQQQRATKGSSNTEYNHDLGEYRPAGEEDRYYAKQRAEAAAAKAKKTTTNESVEYTELLESVLLALCEELQLDPNELVEALRLTPKRSAVLDREEKKNDKNLGRLIDASTTVKKRDANLKGMRHADARRHRIAGIRKAAGVGVKSIAAGDSENRPAPNRDTRHKMGMDERELRGGRTKSTKHHPRNDFVRGWIK